jgi:threonine-phosphate decarboxylase
MLHGHGNNIQGIQHSISVDFSSNVWYKKLNPALKRIVVQNVGKVVDYPAVDAGDLQSLVAKHYNINYNQICITNGATEAFYLIAHAFKNESSTIFYPSFSEYYDAAQLYNHQIYLCNNEGFNPLFDIGSKIVWLANPNNPDGKLLLLDDIEGIIKNNPNTVFVIDEAYGELCKGFSSALKLVQSYPNLIVVKSVTKLCSIPGLRLGYMIGNEELMRKISSFRMPWSVNTLALEAGKYIFTNYHEFVIDKEKLYQESRAFQLALEKLEGVKIVNSTTNYFLGKLSSKKASELKSYLLKDYGFLLRDCSNFYGLTDSHFRLAIQGKGNNELCCCAIDKFLKQ